MACAGRSPAMRYNKEIREKLNFYIIGTIPLSLASLEKPSHFVLGCLNNKDTIERLEWTS